MFAWYPQCSPVLPITCAIPHTVYSARPHGHDETTTPTTFVVVFMMDNYIRVAVSVQVLSPNMVQKFFQVRRQQYQVLGTVLVQYPYQVPGHTTLHSDLEHKHTDTPVRFMVDKYIRVVLSHFSDTVNKTSHHNSKLLYGNPLSGRLSLSSASQDPGL